MTYLTNVWFGDGSLEQLGGILATLGVKRPLVMTDPGVRAAGLLNGLPVSPVDVFDGVDANPTEANVVAGLQRYRESGADGIVAIGGGSPIDCAKAVALLVEHAGALESFAFVHGGLVRITNHQPAVVAVPTTAGTGAEVGRAALISFSNGTKKALISPHLIPDAVICDPSLTLALPPRLTAATGMDAISHCVETFCSPRNNPVADAIALDGLERACRHLRTAVDDGSAREARQEMLMAALEGGLTFQKGLGAVHSLSHPLGAIPSRRLHHGTLNAIFLPHVLNYNIDTCRSKMERMARILGLSGAGMVPEYFDDLRGEIGLPGRLRELGLERGEAEACSEAAAADHCSATNPRPLSLADLRQLYAGSW